MSDRCRCGDPAAKVCACGHESCGLHQEKPRQTVICATCRRPLCFWHFTQRPTVAGVLRLECHPSCSHALTGSSFTDYQRSVVTR